MTAARIYTTAEQLVDQGRYGEAVLLVRHAVLQLPEDSGADALRHRLLLRMAYLQMLAADQTGDLAHAQNAKVMLDRYLAKHEGLFGDGEEARAERGEVYEILYEVETLLEGPGEDEEATEVEEHDVPAQPTAKAEKTFAGQDLEDSFTRKVRVQKQRLADPDDPRVRERLEGDFSSGEAGLVLTKGEFVMLHPARGLVRARGLATAVGERPAEERREARRLGRELLVRARPQLRRCYDAAFARTLVRVSTGTVEASIAPDGSVTKARIVEGGLADALGDVCVIERIEATHLAADTTRTETRVRLPLTFFRQNAVYIYEGTGETFGDSTGNDVQPVKPAVPTEMPPIDDFKR